MEKSANATIDGNCINIIKDKNATQRKKDTAYVTLYERHTNALFYKFVKSGVDKETAEDLISETFKKAFSNIKKYDENTAVFSTWLYTIATNTLIDQKRKGKVEELSLDALSDTTAEDNEGMIFEIKSDLLNPEQEMIKKENTKRVREAIHSMDNKFIRDIMIARYLDELSFEEVAVKLKVEDNSSIRVGARRGFSILKKELV